MGTFVPTVAYLGMLVGEGFDDCGMMMSKRASITQSVQVHAVVLLSADQMASG